MVRNLKLVKKEYVVAPDGKFFRNCHASTIVKTEEGGFLVAYFGGWKEGSPDMSIWLSRFSNGGWSVPEKAFSSYGHPHWNPVLHREGSRIWLFYKVGAAVSSWVTRWACSEDDGRTWSTPRDLVAGDNRPRGPVRNKVLVLSNGTWAAPGSIEGEKYWDSFVDLSSDRGETWTMAPIPLEHLSPARNEKPVWEGLLNDALWKTDLDAVFSWDGVIQPTLWESSPGHIHAFMRTTRGSAFRSDSVDFGKTWCPAYATSIPNNNSGLDIIRMKDGTLVLASNPVSGNWTLRSPLSLSVSEDNGTTFSPPSLNLETDSGEYSYPAIIRDGDELHVTYTWNREGIVHACCVVS